MRKGRAYWVMERNDNIVAVAFDPKINCVLCTNRVECMSVPEYDDGGVWNPSAPTRDSRHYCCQIRCEVEMGGVLDITITTRFNRVHHTIYCVDAFKDYIGVDVCYILDKIYKRR